jgi:phosphoadenosine phosphosulfate reductase
VSTIVDSPADLDKHGALALGPPAALAREIEQAATDLEGAQAEDIFAWAIERFGDGLVVATSFQDCVLIDLAVKAKPSIRFIFLDTGYHFPETLSFLDEVTKHYDLNIEVLAPDIPLDVWPCGSQRCCEFRKVEPLNRALLGLGAWITGLKRVDTPERADAPVVSWDSKGLVKVNPVATWSDEDIEAYVVEHDLLRHPLSAQGYVSIGCAPTTRPIRVGENPRDGRWPDTAKTECGLHL